MPGNNEHGINMDTTNTNTQPDSDAAIPSSDGDQGGDGHLDQQIPEDELPQLESMTQINSSANEKQQTGGGGSGMDYHHDLSSLLQSPEQSPRHQPQHFQPEFNQPLFTIDPTYHAANMSMVQSQHQVMPRTDSGLVGFHHHSQPHPQPLPSIQPLQTPHPLMQLYQHLLPPPSSSNNPEYHQTNYLAQHHPLNSPPAAAAADSSLVFPNISMTGAILPQQRPNRHRHLVPLKLTPLEVICQIGGANGEDQLVPQTYKPPPSAVEGTVRLGNSQPAIQQSIEGSSGSKTAKSSVTSGRRGQSHSIDMSGVDDEELPLSSSSKMLCEQCNHSFPPEAFNAHVAQSTIRHLVEYQCQFQGCGEWFGRRPNKVAHQEVCAYNPKNVKSFGASSHSNKRKEMSTPTPTKTKHATVVEESPKPRSKAKRTPPSMAATLAAAAQLREKMQAEKNIPAGPSNSPTAVVRPTELTAPVMTTTTRANPGALQVPLSVTLPQTMNVLPTTPQPKAPEPGPSTIASSVASPIRPSLPTTAVSSIAHDVQQFSLQLQSQLRQFLTRNQILTKENADMKAVLFSPGYPTLNIRVLNEIELYLMGLLTDVRREKIRREGCIGIICRQQQEQQQRGGSIAMTPKPRSTACLPCSHVCLCTDCITVTTHCPICLGPIVQYLRVSLADAEIAPNVTQARPPLRAPMPAPILPPMTMQRQPMQQSTTIVFNPTTPAPATTSVGYHGPSSRSTPSTGKSTPSTKPASTPEKSKTPRETIEVTSDDDTPTPVAKKRRTVASIVDTIIPTTQPAPTTPPRKSMMSLFKTQVTSPLRRPEPVITANNPPASHTTSWIPSPPPARSNLSVTVPDSLNKSNQLNPRPTPMTVAQSTQPPPSQLPPISVNVHVSPIHQVTNMPMADFHPMNQNQTSPDPSSQPNTSIPQSRSDPMDLGDQDSSIADHFRAELALAAAAASASNELNQNSVNSRQSEFMRTTSSPKDQQHSQHSTDDHLPPLEHMSSSATSYALASPTMTTRALFAPDPNDLNLQLHPLFSTTSQPNSPNINMEQQHH